MISCAIATRVLHVAADECTASQSEDTAAAQSNIFSSEACPSISDETAATAENACTDECVPYLVDIIEDLPDCTDESGLNAKETWESLVSECSAASGSTTNGTNNRTTIACSASEYKQFTNAEEEIFSSTECVNVNDTGSVTLENVCTDECIPFVTDIFSTIPDCEIGGWNPKTTMESLIGNCSTVINGTDNNGYNGADGECTSSDIDTIINVEDMIYSSTSCPAFEDVTATICNDECLIFLGGMIATLPYCTNSGGINAKEGWLNLVHSCVSGEENPYVDPPERTTADKNEVGNRPSERPTNGDADTTSIAVSCLLGVVIAAVLLVTE